MKGNLSFIRKAGVVLLAVSMLMACLAAVAAPANAAGYSVTVSGIVKYNSVPVSGATVTATHGASAPVSTTTSDAGTYSLTVAYPGDYEDTTITAEYNGISLSPVIGRDELKMSGKITRDFNLVSKGTPTPTYAPKPKENRFYIFTLVDGKATNGIPVTCTYKGLTFTGTSGNVDIEDADIPYSYHGPGVAAFYLPTGGDGSPKFKVDTADYFAETSFGPFPEPFYKHGEMTITRRTTATPTPGSMVNVKGYVFYNGVPAPGANMSLIYGGFTQSGLSQTDGSYGFFQTYFGGPATVRATYNGVSAESTVTPAADVGTYQNLSLVGPARNMSNVTLFADASAAPAISMNVTATPAPVLTTMYIQGRVTYDGTPVDGVNVTIDVSAWPTTTVYTHDGGVYGESVNPYRGGPVTIRVSYRGVDTEYTTTPTVSPGEVVNLNHDFSLTSLNRTASSTPTPAPAPFPGVGLTLLAVLATVLACCRRK